MFDESDVKALNMLAAFAGAAKKAYQAGAGTGLLSPGVFTAAKALLADDAADRDAFVAVVNAAAQTRCTDTTTFDYPQLTTSRGGSTA